MDLRARLGFGLGMDKLINKTDVISGLFGLITANLLDTHEASVAGQGRGNVCYAHKGTTLVEQDALAILVPLALLFQSI